MIEGFVVDVVNCIKIQMHQKHLNDHITSGKVVVLDSVIINSAVL